MYLLDIKRLCTRERIRIMDKIRLLDYLSGRLGLSYLSELHDLSAEQKEKMCRLLKEEVPLDRCTEAAWLDACEYITGEKADTAGAAYEKLLDIHS